MKPQGNYRFPLVQQGRYRSVHEYQIQSMDRPHQGGYPNTPTMSHQGGRNTPNFGYPNTPTHHEGRITLSSGYPNSPTHHEGRITPSSGYPHTPTMSPRECFGYPLDSGVESEAARSLLNESIDTSVPHVLDDLYNPRPLLAAKPRLYNQDMETIRPPFPPHKNLIGQNMKERSKLCDANDYILGKINGEHEILNIHNNEEGLVKTEYVGSLEDNKTNEG